MGYEGGAAIGRNPGTALSTGSRNRIAALKNAVEPLGRIRDLLGAVGVAHGLRDERNGGEEEGATLEDRLRVVAQGAPLGVRHLEDAARDQPAEVVRARGVARDEPGHALLPVSVSYTHLTLPTIYSV